MVKVVKLADVNESAKKDAEGYLITMTEQEALQTIKSLTNQMLKRTPNAERWEAYEGVPYFSIGIDFSGDKDCAKCRREMDERLFKVIEQTYKKQKPKKKREPLDIRSAFGYCKGHDGEKCTKGYVVCNGSQCDDFNPEHPKAKAKKKR